MDIMNDYAQNLRKWLNTAKKEFSDYLRTVSET